MISVHHFGEATQAVCPENGGRTLVDIQAAPSSGRNAASKHEALRDPEFCTDLKQFFAGSWCHLATASKTGAEGVLMKPRLVRPTRQVPGVNVFFHASAQAGLVLGA